MPLTTLESPSQRDARFFKPRLNEVGADPRVGLDTRDAPSTPAPRWRPVLATFLLAVVFAGSLALNLGHNDFPLSYHEDESTKAVQVASDTRNYHHPQLLLEVTQWAWNLFGKPSDLHATAVIGRSVSATFASLAAVAAAILFYRVGGLPGLCLGGAAVGTCPALLVHAHYMKEDAALVFGACVVLLASQVFWARREKVAVWQTLFLSAACGAAASAKFAGAFAFIACLPLVALGGRLTWRRGAVRVALFLTGLLVTVAAINHRALEEPRRALSRISDEHRHATTRHVGFTMNRPNAFHATAFARQTMPYALALSGAYLLFALARPKRAGGWTLWTLAFAVGYLAMLSWSVLPYNRYALPVVVLAHVVAALALLRLAGAIPSIRPRMIATLGAAGVVLALQLPRCLDFDRQFADDSRDRLRRWVMRNLPPDTVIVQDAHVMLDGPFDPRLGVRETPQFLLYGPESSTGGPAASAGPLNELARAGVEYVAVTDFCFGRYLDPNLRPAPGTAGVFEYRKRWYEELFREHELAWSSAPKHPTYSHFNNPELRLYRLRRVGTGGTEQ